MLDTSNVLFICCTFKIEIGGRYFLNIKCRKDEQKHRNIIIGIYHSLIQAKNTS